MLCSIQLTIGAFEKSTNSRSRSLMALLKRGLAYRVGCRWLLRLRYVKSERNALDAPFRIFALNVMKGKLVSTLLSQVLPRTQGDLAKTLRPESVLFLAVTFPRTQCSCISVMFYQPRQRPKVCCSQRHQSFCLAANLSTTMLSGKTTKSQTSY